MIRTQVQNPFTNFIVFLEDYVAGKLLCALLKNTNFKVINTYERQYLVGLSGLLVTSLFVANCTD